MRLMKSFLVFLAIVSISVACSSTPTATLPDGLYIPPASVYFALTSKETQALQVAVIQFHREPPIDSKSSITQTRVELIGETGEVFPVAGCSWTQGTTTDQYTMKTLRLGIPEFEEGRHLIRGLRLTQDSKQYEYNIGQWLIEVFPQPSHTLEIGKQSSLTASGPELHLQVELRNTGERIVTIKSLDVEIPGCHYVQSVAVTRSFDDPTVISGDDRMELEPGEMKSFFFRLAQKSGEVIPDFVTVRPLLRYVDADGNIKQLLLRPVIYTVFLDTDEEVQAVAAKGKPVQTIP